MLLSLAFVLGCMGVGVYLIVTSRTRQVESGPRCGGCGYNLTGATTNRCPECGALFIDAGVITERAAHPRTRMRIGVLLIALPLLPIGLGLTASLVGYRRATAAQSVAAQQQASSATTAKFLRNALSASASQPASRPSSPE